MKNRTVMVMAAITGGHIVPGLAVAHELQARGWKVVWLGTRHGMENRLVPRTGIRLEQLNFEGLRGKGLLRAAKGTLQLIAAFFNSAVQIFRHRPDLVLSMGGYICIPGGLMAGLLWKPLVLLNADAGLLLSNKILLPFATRLACGFDGTAARNSKALITGNPICAALENIAEPRERFASRSGPLKVLVVGGSLGAKILNETLPDVMAKLPATLRPQLTHQTGEENFTTVEAAYQALGLRDQVELLPFVDDMSERLIECDLMICRAGAITVSELCAAGVPSVLVPLMISTTSHQRENAEWMAQAGAAWHLPQTELNVDQLVSLLSKLDRHQLLKKAERARALAHYGATQRVADLCEQVLNA